MNIEEMIDGYIECALWADEPDGEDWRELSDTARSAMRTDVGDFVASCPIDLTGRESSAGHDFWLSRQGHGTGFWDAATTRRWSESEGEALDAIAKVFGHCDIYSGDDGLIYIMGRE